MAPYSVLVVEDDPTDALLFTTAFSHRDEKAHVQVARSAEEAIAHLTDADSAHNVLPDIIILDIFVDGVGGLGRDLVSAIVNPSAWANWTNCNATKA